MEPEKHTWDKVNHWEEELDFLKAILAKTELVETVKWGGPTYTIDNKNVLGLGGFKNFVTIWFYNGVYLKDSAKVLVNANEGVTKALRQWRFTSKVEIMANEKTVLHYVNEAIANSKAGIAIKPEKKPVVISAFFQNELDSDTAFAEAFAAFTPFKQKEFLEHVDTAKRDETKIARMEKIKPMVLGGIGLNDKYRS